MCISGGVAGETNADTEPDIPDLGACLIHQKLQLINLCIHRQLALQVDGIVSPAVSRLPGTLSWEGSDSIDSKYESCEDEDGLPTASRATALDSKRSSSTGYPTSMDGAMTANSEPGKHHGQDEQSCGIAGVMSGCKLLNGERDIRVPVTLAIPVYTADTLAEQQSTLAALEESAEGQERASRLQARVLISDMSAFKSANPGCQIEDFVRWHSPKDWVIDKDGVGKLSTRMMQANNRWKQYWDEVDPCPAHRQQPLMDPLVEGERALHYLETIPPSELFEQLLHAAFIGSLDCLSRAPCTSTPAVQHSLVQFSNYIASWDPSEDSLSRHHTLLPAFAFLERTVVLGEVLMRKLSDCPSTVCALLDLLIERKADAAGDERDGLEICDKEKKFVAQLFSSNSEDTDWGLALEHEWVVTCENQEENREFHRVYVKDGVLEARVATAVSAGNS